MSTFADSWKITRNNTTLGQVLSFTPSIDQTSIKSRSLDGTIHIQTIGTGVQKASVSVFSSWEEMIRVNEAEADGAAIKIVYRGRYYVGYISEAIDWDTVEPYKWYRGGMELLIEDKGDVE